MTRCNDQVLPISFKIDVPAGSFSLSQPLTVCVPHENDPSFWFDCLVGHGMAMLFHDDQARRGWNWIG